MSYEYTASAAKAMFESLCTALDNRGWKYQRDDEKWAVHFGVNGDDLPMNFLILVSKEVPFLQLFSQLPFTVPEDKRVEMAVVVAVSNYGCTNGSFEFDLSDGKILYKLPQYFADSLIGDGCIQYMISLSCQMVDQYNDRFMALSKGIMTLTDFLKKENEG